MADIFLRPPILTAGNFEALWPKDPKFLALKDLKVLKGYAKKNKRLAGFLGLILLSKKDLISLHKHAKQRFHMNVAVCAYFATAVALTLNYRTNYLLCHTDISSVKRLPHRSGLQESSRLKRYTTN